MEALIRKGRFIVTTSASVIIEKEGSFR